MYAYFAGQNSIFEILRFFEMGIMNIKLTMTSTPISKGKVSEESK